MCADGLTSGQFQLGIILGCASALWVSFRDQQLPGGRALSIIVISRVQEIVVPLEAQLRTVRPSLSPAFH